MLTIIILIAMAAVFFAAAVFNHKRVENHRFMAEYEAHLRKRR